MIVLYLKAGTLWKLPQGDSFLGLLQTGEWQLRDVVANKDALFLIPPGEAYAIHTIGGLGERGFKGWYVNLQEPVRRTGLGFDHMDHALDIVVSPDLTEWHWHDEDELDEVPERGLFSADLVQQIRSAGERVVDRIQARSSPFVDGWETWSPPQEWLLPGLQQGWDKV